MYGISDDHEMSMNKALLVYKLQMLKGEIRLQRHFAVTHKVKFPPYCFSFPGSAQNFLPHVIPFSHELKSHTHLSFCSENVW